MNKITLAGVIGLALLVLIVIVRALMYAPADVPDIAPLEHLVDEDRLGQNLAAAIRFRTISNQPPIPLDPAPFKAFIDWVNATCSEVANNLEQEHPGGYSILLV